VGRVLSALATGHKVGIAVVAAVFIAFALASSFLFPRWQPSFPGRRVGFFVLLTALFTAGMLATMIALAGEPKEERAAAGEQPAESAPPPPPPPSTTTTTTRQAPSSTTTNAAPAAPPTTGDAAAGKSLFTAQGCSACHTYKPAGSTAKVGPDLDNVAADAAKANRGPVDRYIAESIRDPTAYTVPGYPQGVMPPFQLSDKQVDDLVAFLTGG
jgi:mono/diheme cytochrome c family protein